MASHYRSKSTMGTTKYLHEAPKAFELLTYRLTTSLGPVHSLCINSLGPIVADSDQTQIKSQSQSQFPEKMEGKTREDLEKNGMIDTWLKKHRLLYTGATKHPFILSIRDGTIDLSSFRTWLGQDYLFVREFAAFVAGVLVKAWKQSDDSYGDTEVILGGLAALNDEVEWFKREASKWDVPLSTIAPQKANGDYCRFLEYLISPEVGFTEAITAFWAIEAVYQESFAHCLEDGYKTPPELQETCQRWGNDGFGQYCLSLKKIANRCLEKASEDAQLFNASKEVLNKAEVALIRVLEHEVEFWNMSRGGS